MQRVESKSDNSSNKAPFCEYRADELVIQGDWTPRIYQEYLRVLRLLNPALESFDRRIQQAAILMAAAYHFFFSRDRDHKASLELLFRAEKLCHLDRFAYYLKGMNYYALNKMKPFIVAYEKLLTIPHEIDGPLQNIVLQARLCLMNPYVEKTDLRQARQNLLAILAHPDWEKHYTISEKEALRKLAIKIARNGEAEPDCTPKAFQLANTLYEQCKKKKQYDKAWKHANLLFGAVPQNPNHLLQRANARMHLPMTVDNYELTLYDYRASVFLMECNALEDDVRLLTASGAEERALRLRLANNRALITEHKVSLQAFEKLNPTRKPESRPVVEVVVPVAPAPVVHHKIGPLALTREDVKLDDELVREEYRPRYLDVPEARPLPRQSHPRVKWEHVPKPPREESKAENTPIDVLPIVQQTLDEMVQAVEQFHYAELRNCYNRFYYRATLPVSGLTAIPLEAYLVLQQLVAAGSLFSFLCGTAVRDILMGYDDSRQIIDIVTDSPQAMNLVLFANVIEPGFLSDQYVMIRIGSRSIRLQHSAWLVSPAESHPLFLDAWTRGFCYNMAYVDAAGNVYDPANMALFAMQYRQHLTLADLTGLLSRDPLLQLQLIMDSQRLQMPLQPFQIDIIKQSASAFSRFASLEGDDAYVLRLLAALQQAYYADNRAAVFGILLKTGVFAALFPTLCHGVEPLVLLTTLNSRQFTTLRDALLCLVMNVAVLPAEWLSLINRDSQATPVDKAAIIARAADIVRDHRLLSELCGKHCAGALQAMLERRLQVVREQVAVLAQKRDDSPGTLALFSRFFRPAVGQSAVRVLSSCETGYRR